jgi:Aberrant zinc-finger
MDKHQRPYKCPENGCEKLNGFINSAGLRRHGREVHNQYGGPQEQLNCPYTDCNRHTGTTFSRKENLNDHLRRVHPQERLNCPYTDCNRHTEKAFSIQENLDDHLQRIHGVETDDDEGLREEMEILKQETQELKKQFKTQNVRSMDMKRRIMQLQKAYGLA